MHLWSERSGTRRDVFDVSTKQVSDLMISVCSSIDGIVYLSENQSIIKPVSNLSGCPPVV